MTVGIVPIQRAYAATMDALRAVHHEADPRCMEDLRQALLRQREAIERGDSASLISSSDVVSRMSASLAGARPMTVRAAAAVAVAGEAAVNQRLLRQTLEEGDAYVQQLFATKRPA
ncbi:MAG TPA: hypothetical protein VFA43_07315 [Gemmatimonadaceae bacterium]|nr:hypothetical protein [Gemmatimonadaceae bacterium]